MLAQKAFRLTVVPRVAVSLMGIAVSLTAAGAVADDSSPTPQQGDAFAAAAGGPEFVGNGGCVRCHRGNPTFPEADETSRTDFCLLNESSIFAPPIRSDASKPTGDLPAGDIHRLAYSRLEVEKPDSLGNRIWNYVRARSPGDEEKKLDQARQCLSCHAGWRNEPGHPHERPPFFHTGVTCETCHGSSARWFRSHTLVEWRTQAGSEKEKNFGQTDVRDPVRRAKLCFSCHIGNAEMGRIVTHDMYVGGHPPLPPMEIETFAERMPKHWRTIREKGDFLNRKEFLAKNYTNAGAQIESELPQTRAMLVGSLVSLSESLRLFSGMLSSEKGPDFAAYDCFACHHELTSRSWRQARYSETKARPGQLRPLEWPTALASIGLRYADPPNAAMDSQRMEAALTQIDRAFQTRAFGDAAAVRDIVGGPNQAGLADWLEQKARDLASRTIDRAQAEAAYQDLKELNASETLDYYSAVQSAVAMRLISRELATDYPRIVESRNGTAPAFLTRKNDNANDQERGLRDADDISVLLAWRKLRKQSDTRVNERFLAAFRRTPTEPSTDRNEPAELLLLDFPTFRKERTEGVAFAPFLEHIRYYSPNDVRKAIAGTPSIQSP